MPLTSFLALLSLVAHLTFVPQSVSLRAAHTYLPYIDAVIPKSPPPVLQVGLYEYDDGFTRVYFSVINLHDYGATVDYGGFSLASPDDVYCGLADRYFENNVSFWHSQFEAFRGGLTCTLISDHQALCEIDDDSVRSPMSSDDCGHGVATVTRIE